MKVVALAGGVGAARFLLGLIEIVPQEDLTLVVNTGDDFRWMGLYVCPDLDTVTYTLAGRANPETGWGVRGDSFHCLQQLEVLGGEAWFRIGDMDLATHLLRTSMLGTGSSLTEVTATICARHAIRCRVLPMSDAPIPTIVHTDEGSLGFQEYFVRRKCRPRVLGFTFRDIEHARPSPGLLEALHSASTVIVCPSNPFISIGPILAVPGIREALLNSPAKAVAVSPLVGGKAIKGPTANMLDQLGHEVSAAGVAAIYADILDAFVLDYRDRELYDRITDLGLSVRTTETIMESMQSRRDLARTTLELAR
jgi:LPPG:FO 2-phospho-L-lactate transferase